MTWLALLSAPITVLILSFAIFWLIPRVRRDRFQFRMLDLALEIDELIDENVLSHYRYVNGLRNVAYHAAEHPEFARLRDATYAYLHSNDEAVSQIGLDRDRYRLEVSQAESYIADALAQRMALDISRQALRGSMWLLWLVVFPLARAKKAAEVRQAEQVLVAQFV